MTFKILKSFILLIAFGITSNISAQFENNENNYNIYAVNIPKKLSFSNEETPINKLNIKERFDKEILINTYWQSKTILLIKRAEKYFPIIEEILQENNIPDDFKYLAVAESGLENVTSPSGAKGFWQILKKTGLELGLEINDEIDERYNLEKSTHAACEYIKKAYDVFGDWTLSAAAYNMGITGLKKSIELQKVNNYYDLMLNNETYRYIFRILAIKEIIQKHINYGFIINENDYYNEVITEPLQIDTAINNIADFSLENGFNYNMIKILNPWILGNKISNKQKKEYTLQLPIDKYKNQKKLDTIIYFCKSKENLFEIARKNNIEVENLLIWNNLLPSKKLKKNQKIIILK